MKRKENKEKENWLLVITSDYQSFPIEVRKKIVDAIFVLVSLWCLPIAQRYNGCIKAVTGGIEQ